MSSIIKLTRVKREKNGVLIEFDIYVNPSYIMCFRSAEKNEHGSTRFDIFFPDTVRSYNVKETAEEVYRIINNFQDCGYTYRKEEDCLADKNPFDPDDGADR